MAKLPLSGQSILVIEGSVSSAVDLRIALMRRGAIVHVVSTVHAGLMIASRKQLDGAILDCVSHGPSLPLCRELSAQGIPFMFYGGIAGQDGDEAASCMAELVATERRKSVEERSRRRTFGSGEDWHHVA